MHSTTAAPATVDSAALRAEIETTREAFHTLVASIADSRWLGRVPGSGWTGKQVLHHLTWALEQLPKEVESAKRGKGMFNYPGFVANPGSYWLVRWEARKQTRETIRSRYDAAVAKALEALRRVDDGEWHRGARFYGEGFYSVADLFRTPSSHFQQHVDLSQWQ